MVYTVICMHARQTNWATDNWVTIYGQQPTGRHILVNCMGDNIGSLFKDVNVGKIFKIISF